MKRTAILILLCIVHNALCISPVRAQKETRIALDLKGLQAEDSLTLSWGTFNKPASPLILQASVQEAQALRIPLNEPRLIIIGLKGYAGGYELLASPDEDIRVSGRVHKGKNGRHPSLEFPRIKVDGAAWHLPYESAMAEYMLHLDSLTTSINNDFHEVQRLIRKAKEEKDEQTIAYMYQTLQGKDYINRMTTNYADMNNYLKEVVLRQKDNFLAPLLMLRFGGNLDKSAQSLYDALSDEAKQSYYGREVKDAVYPPTMVGTIAPTVAVMTHHMGHT